MPDIRIFGKLIEMDILETATLAAGCFWCVEAVFDDLKGVEDVVSGYSGGKEKNPTYEEVGSGQTGHAESVQVYYDPKVISYATLLKVFFADQDPTTPNRQGPDVGSQYRSVVFFRNAEEKQQAELAIKALNASGKYSNPVVTQVVPFEAFYPAEDYHQGYYRLHPENPYVQHVSKPRVERFQKEFKDLLKQGQ